MNKNIFLVIGSALFLTSCAAKLTSSMQKTYPPLDYTQKVRVFEVDEQAPPNAEKLGTLKVGDSGFSIDCGYAVVLDKAKTETRKAGGNALKITNHSAPDIWSTCHRITADVLKLEITEDTTEAAEAAEAEHAYRAVFPHFRLAADGGWQYRTAKVSSELDAEWREHYKKMKSGFHYGVQAAYFFTEYMGAELMFSQQLFGRTLGYGALNDRNGNYIGSGTLSDKIAFSYIGANYMLRLFDFQKKNCWVFAIGFGYMGYTDRLFSNDAESIKITASTLGSNLSVGYDIGLSKEFALGFKVSLMGGTFKNYKQTINGTTTSETMPDKILEGLGTVQLSVGLRLNK
ncbi:MAG: hypothetical protein LBG47_06900 [Prevotellaceae bacterium]|jgi:hypothetical protein|nr:hypothetical protein [Prevotellaceae bacterium]